MTKPEVSGIAPFFIVKDVPSALSFYRDRLGFEITFKGLIRTTSSSASSAGCSDDHAKAVGIDPLPNCKRDVKKGVARWDAYLYVPDPDALASNLVRAMSSFLSH